MGMIFHSLLKSPMHCLQFTFYEYMRRITNMDSTEKQKKTCTNDSGVNLGSAQEKLRNI